MATATAAAASPTRPRRIVSLALNSDRSRQSEHLRQTRNPQTRSTTRDSSISHDGKRSSVSSVSNLSSPSAGTDSSTSSTKTSSSRPSPTATFSYPSSTTAENHALEKPFLLRRLSAWFASHRRQHDGHLQSPHRLSQGTSVAELPSHTSQGFPLAPSAATSALATQPDTAADPSQDITATASPPKLELDTTNVPTPLVLLEAPTPVQTDFEPGLLTATSIPPIPSEHTDDGPSVDEADSSSLDQADDGRPQSLVDSTNANIEPELIATPLAGTTLPRQDNNLPIAVPRLADGSATTSLKMAAAGARRIWVKRPAGSATLVQIQEGDLVDDVRDTILRKYANSLGKAFDAPDMVLRIVHRSDHSGPRTDRMLSPEEEMCKILDACYPGGQTVDEALLVDVPPRKTPRPSPKVHHHTSYHAVEDYRPLENGNGYFPPMSTIIPQSVPQTSNSHDGHLNHHHQPNGTDHPRSISVLNTGTLPPLHSPGLRGTRRSGEHRPKYIRNHTSSPTIVSHSNAGAVAVEPPQVNVTHGGRHRVDSSASESLHVPSTVPPVAPLPTPPVPDMPAAKPGSTPPTPSGAPTVSHRAPRPRKHRKSTPDRPGAHRRHLRSNSSASNYNLAASILDGSVPPINVLIVEDNVINLRILEGLMKRLKVRWQTAINGQIAVDKWKAGGFHLVLMDIQMPVMNGLQATKEIRRLERVNGIGVFSSIDEVSNLGGSASEEDSDKDKDKDTEGDQLQMSEGLFKSPVIIVALTASSLQSDRHEALAAGCNDFLTKPVDFVWLERKVKEWGCMQALIDFDGWRKWKDYANKQEADKAVKQKREERVKE